MTSGAGPEGKASHARPATPAAEVPTSFAVRAAPAHDEPLARTLAGAVQRRAQASASGPVLARDRTRRTGTARGRGKGRGTGLAVKMKRTRTPPTTTAPRRSGRVRYLPNEVDQQIDWSGPRYGPSDSVAGGTSVIATLGPAAGQPVNYGSVPGTSSCTAVTWLNDNNYAGSIWIKGHLLNDNLGGPGVSKNLTPMTHTANMQYKAFEASVKNALAICYSRGKRNLDGRRHWYGVRYDVSVIGTRWPTAPQRQARAVARRVDATADYVEKVGDAAPVVINDPPWAPALVPVNIDPAT